MIIVLIENTVRSMKTFHFFITIFCFIFFASSSGQEPDGRCSRFDCDYKIIERLVRLEVSRDELQKTIKELQLADQAQSQVIDQLTQQIQALNSTKPTVALKVRLSKKVTVNVGQRIIYDTVVTDFGNSFIATSGSFRAPTAGTFIFSVTACSENNDWGVLNIVNDGTTVGQVRTGDDKFNDCNSEVTVRYLEEGSAVWVERAEGGKGIQNTKYWNSFTAALLH